MITIVAKCSVMEDKIQEYMELAKKMMEETRKEKGCINYTLYQDINDPKVFCFIEYWENQECLDGHNSSEHFLTLVPQLNKMRTESIINKFQEV